MTKKHLILIAIIGGAVFYFWYKNRSLATSSAATAEANTAKTTYQPSAFVQARDNAETSIVTSIGNYFSGRG